MRTSLLLIATLICVYKSNAQSWVGTSLEFTSPGTTYTKFQFAEHTWSGSHAILFNAYKSIGVNGSLLSTGNTKYANNVGAYGGGAGAIFYNGNGGGMYFCISPSSTGIDTNIDWGGVKMFINRAGQVGVGTTSIPSGYKLAVDGKAIVEEVQVASTGNWPDYVFTDTYKLNSLSEVSTFITENGHLPNIPTAKEVKENGIKLGEMNAKLLEKVEELTLYLIEQSKQINALKSENDMQNRIIKEILNEK